MKCIYRKNNNNNKNKQIFKLDGENWTLDSNEFVLDFV